MLLKAERSERLVDHLHRTAQLPAGARKNENVVHEADDALNLLHCRVRKWPRALLRCDAATRPELRATRKSASRARNDAIDPTRSNCDGALCGAVGSSGEADWYLDCRLRERGKVSR